MYQGRSSVDGYYVDIREAEAPEEAWRGVNNKAAEKTFIKVICSLRRSCKHVAAAGGQLASSL